MILMPERGLRVDETSSTLTGRIVYPVMIGLCEACGIRDATETVTFADGRTFAVCWECSP